MSNDPLGCKPCYCSLHSSECELDMSALAIAANKPGNSLVEADKVIINCPADQQPCSACLQKDRQHIRVECNGTSDGILPCMCVKDPNQCQYCPTGWRSPQKDPRSEICTCPPQYVGKSCENCADGFRLDPPNGLPTDRCVACTCNNHSTVCHPKTGQCECQHNTGGLFCDRCADGYYGNALAQVGSSAACKPCPCPSGAKCEEVFWQDRGIEVLCTDCPDNRAGARCERCSENYYGDPTKGVPCKPCDCSNNVDPREFGNCDGITGECLKCIFGTTGKRCEQCLPGYRRNFKPANETTPRAMNDTTGLMVPARGCSPCYCDPVGTLASYGPKGIAVCNPETGQCPCKPGVGGLRCEQCYQGFYGFHTGQGCKPCDCDSIGAISEACDDRTGRCTCRPHVTGRQCDQCMAGHFNLTSALGCQDCQCHPYGAKDKQCDAGGQCQCKPFAVGEKCDQCQENHYSLEAGCLPCPACYNLVQARVAKLWGMLESVFGPLRPDSKPESQPTPDDKDLYAEVKKLNDTIIALYRRVLKIGDKSSVVNPDQLLKTVEALAQQVDKVKLDLDETRKQGSVCASTTKLDADMDKLKKEITERLPILLSEDLQKIINKLKKSTESYQPDVALTNEANGVDALASRLSKQQHHLREISGTIGRLIDNATKQVTESEEAVMNSKKLLQISEQKADLIAQKHTEHTRKIEATNELLQRTRDQVYQLKSGVDQIPDLRKEVRLLESVKAQWEEAKNTSKALQKQLNASGLELTYTLDRVRQINNQLRDSLSDRHSRAKLLEPRFKELQLLLDRVQRAQNVSWHAVNQARTKADQLKNFEDYIAQTKGLIPQAMAGQAELLKRLDKVEGSVKDLHEQAKQELDAAYKLQNRTAELQKVLNGIKKMITEGKKQSEAGRTRLSEMRSRYDVEIVHEVSKATTAIASVGEQAQGTFKRVSDTQQKVKQMGEEAADMLKRMKKLKDQLTESTGKGSGAIVNGEDAATRFARLKATLKNLRLSDRMTQLHKLNYSRTIELDYLRNELDEFKAHYEHLRMVNTLLPLRDSGCFYTGKEIEGDIPSFRTTKGG
ncbi:hypothetical protein EG68_04815 [Paragonimus skrjabini miyazakii]|uniref:Laminin EGF-like domain-containing protein n=1 Tax=Paragonimus skrjabini miyazakii TaxID=59628 RepID=A0A8S9YAZ5_9TREM|nr:hypothetical protein EG68_04815 [Paragonimus skrjabini miyazakii]